MKSANRYRFLPARLWVVGIMGLCFLSGNRAFSQNATSTLPVRDKTYYPEAYGAKPDVVGNDKAGIQAAHDAAETAGGGVVLLREGTWEIHPLATGIGLLFNGDKVILRGEGPKTILRIISTTSSSPFEGIAPKGYNTTTSPYGASGLWVENLTIECDSYLQSADADNLNAHGLIGCVNCPWAYIKGVTFGKILYHQLEAGFAQNVVVEDCVFKDQTESCRIQIDTGLAGARSVPVGNYTCQNIYIRRNRLAGLDRTGCTLDIPRMIEISHSSAQIDRNIVIEENEIGTVYKAGTYYAGYGVANDGVMREISGLTIRKNRFLGMGMGQSFGIYLVPGVGLLENVLVEDNSFGPGIDANGVRHGGGFFKCIIIGNNRSASNVVAGSGTTTDYATRRNIVVRNNILAPRFTTGSTAFSTTAFCEPINIGGLASATITGNLVRMPTFTSANTFTNSSSIITSTAAHELELEDLIKFNTNSGSLPTSFLQDVTGGAIEESDDVYTKVAHGLTTGQPVCIVSLTGGTGVVAAGGYYFHRLTADTGYLCATAALATAGTAINVTLDATDVVITPLHYVVDVPTATTFKVSATLGGTAITANSGGGTHEWTQQLMGGTVMSYCGALIVYDIQNAVVSNNSVLWQHGDNLSSTLPYSMPVSWKAAETAGINGFVVIENNWVSETGAGSCTAGLVDYGTVVTTPTIQGRVRGNTHIGTFSSANVLTCHPAWATYYDTSSGAASLPILNLTGTPFAGTGTTSFPLAYLNQSTATASTTLNTAGTFFGINSHGTQDFVNYMFDGVSKYKVDSTGGITSAGALTLGTTTSQITGAAGNMTITAGTGNSRTMELQTTTAGGVATTALTLNADQSATFAAGISATTGAFSGAISAAAGAAGTPSITFTGDPNTGFYNNGADLVFITAGGVYQGYLGGSWSIKSAGVFGFEGGGAASAKDIALSRLSAGVLAVGTGAQGSTGGSISAAAGTFSGPITASPQTTTLAAAATTVAVTASTLILTGDGGGNTIATITGGVAGMELTILFRDALVTITDTDANTANTVDLSAAFTSSARDTMKLLFDGTKWFEVSRSVN